MRVFKFTVPGEPQHKRSANPYFDHESGKPVMHPHKKNGPAATAIRKAAKAAGWNGETHTGGVQLGCRFFFPIPKSWTKAQKAHALRSFHIDMPDLDRLHNMIQDALTTYTVKDRKTGEKKPVPGMWDDDSQVCGYHNPIKRYSTNPRTEVTVYFLDDADNQLNIDGANELF